LLFQMSQLLNHQNYVVARTKILGYMTQSIKSDGREPLVLNGPDALRLKNKKVVLLDDVISTGKAMKEMKNLMIKVKAQTVAIACVLKQGKLKVKIEKPFFYLQKIPLFHA
jgi:adenine phosphoribosyltransferase